MVTARIACKYRAMRQPQIEDDATRLCARYRSVDCPAARLSLCYQRLLTKLCFILQVLWVKLAGDWSAISMPYQQSIESHAAEPNRSFVLPEHCLRPESVSRLPDVAHI